VPRYFFNIIGPELSEDALGSELANEHVARSEAIRLIRELLEEGPIEGWVMEKWRVVVTNSAGTIVCQLPITPATVSN
jgi:hypothetical protein